MEKKYNTLVIKIMSKGQILLNFNSEIRTILASHHIPIHDGLTFLMCLHYGISPSFIPSELERKVLACRIVNKDYIHDEIKWLVPLFEEGESGFEWIGEWMDMFKKVNPERRGTKADVLRRMKKFFVNNPSIRKDEVIAATQEYLDSITQAVYCKKSHKFIYEMDGSSMLFDYVERIQKRIKVDDYKNDDFI